MKIIKLIQTKRNYKLAGPDRLRIDVNTDDLASRVTLIKDIFKMLS
jgi:transcription-repair coupling factor (superfamily II helicase)